MKRKRPRTKVSKHLVDDLDAKGVSSTPEISFSDAWLVATAIFSISHTTCMIDTTTSVADQYRQVSEDVINLGDRMLCL